MIIPWDQLSPEALHGLVEEFVTRDGTDLTEARRNITRVMEALRRGHVEIVFDEEEGTTDIRPVEPPARRPGQSRSARHDDTTS